MSIQFNDTSTHKGLIQKIERMLSFDDGFISGNTTRMKQWTADVNIAIDDLLALVFQADGSWQFDDSSHDDFPIITTNLVDGQRDYTFVNDESGNLILDIFKVLVAQEDANAPYDELKPVDAQSEDSAATRGLTEGLDDEGIPRWYDKTANGIFLEPIPSYNKTNGLKVYIDRETTYFTTADTTKKPGFDGRVHLYLALKPAYEYARDKGMKQANRLERDLEKMKNLVEAIYGRRERDVTPKLVSNITRHK